MAVSGMGARLRVRKIKPIGAMAARRFRQSCWWKIGSLGRF
jgi:hypothetical protein